MITKRNSRHRVIVNIAIDLLLLPLVCCVTLWACSREKKILREGKPLTADQILLARAVGVAVPQRVRVMAVYAVPTPFPQWLRGVVERLGWLSPHIAGMTLGYGIVLRVDMCVDLRLLAHELAHVAQYERFGQTGEFMREYVRECVWPGYPHGPLEIEAQQAERVAYPSATRPTQVRGNVIPYAAIKMDDAHGCSSDVGGFQKISGNRRVNR
jgi:hypothetical protein